MQSVRGPGSNPVQCELDQVLWDAWLEVQDKVLGHEIELRRRLDRRAKMHDRVPRPLCLALKASDRRDELEAHLAHTDLHLICQKRCLKGRRAALREWWTQNHPFHAQIAA